VEVATGEWLASQHGIRQLGGLGFENAYALVVTSAVGERLSDATISGLAPASESMKLGGDYEFFERPEWRQLRQAYGLRFSETISYDSTFMYDAVVGGVVDVIAAFSSDGRIAAYDLVVLDDPKQALPPYDAVLLLAPELADDPAVIAALLPLVGSIAVEDMREANWMVDRAEQKRSLDEAAAWLDARR
jgi:osmoprotectant transport system permease protein